MRLAAMVPALAALLLVGCVDRVADEPIEYDFEALKLDACERGCATIDACGHGDYEDSPFGADPPDCFTRCLTIDQQLFEENQCASRQIEWLRCMGEVECEDFEPFGSGWKVAKCDEFDYCNPDEPFELDDE